MISSEFPPLTAHPIFSSIAARIRHQPCRNQRSIETYCIENGCIRVDQLNQCKEIFTRFNMNSDGILTMLELAALQRSIGLKPSGDQIHVLLANMDANGNGSVEFDELGNAILPEMNYETVLNQERLTEVFHLFDCDGNDYITAAKLAGCMTKRGHPLAYKELTETINEADADGDGFISFNEFSSTMAKSAMDFLGTSLPS